MEVVVLRELASQGMSRTSRILVQGRTRDVNFIIMTLVGPSLQDLKKACNNKFSLSSALRLGIQCLEALEDLHGIGYLHRDVKPGNFAVGPEGENKPCYVMIINFGMARFYRRVNYGAKELSAPRQVARFRGTHGYAPITTHKLQEKSRKDDLESWFYQQVELTVGRLPWCDVSDNLQLLLKRKEESRLDGSLISGCPEEYTRIIAYIDALCYTDKPEYERIRSFMMKLLSAKRFKDSDPYDWEIRSRPTSSGGPWCETESTPTRFGF